MEMKESKLQGLRGVDLSRRPTSEVKEVTAWTSQFCESLMAEKMVKIVRANGKVDGKESIGDLHVNPWGWLVRGVVEQIIMFMLLARSGGQFSRVLVFNFPNFLFELFRDVEDFSKF